MPFKKALDYDLVYESQETGEFISVHVDLHVSADDNLELVLETESLPDLSEVNEILRMIRGNKLGKLGFSIWDDFKITIKVDEKSYIVLTDNETLDATNVLEV